jgi:hypothetical protein
MPLCKIRFACRVLQQLLASMRWQDVSGFPKLPHICHSLLLPNNKLNTQSQGRQSTPAKILPVNTSAPWEPLHRLCRRLEGDCINRSCKLWFPRHSRYLAPAPALYDPRIQQ